MQISLECVCNAIVVIAKQHCELPWNLNPKPNPQCHLILVTWGSGGVRGG